MSKLHHSPVDGEQTRFIVFSLRLSDAEASLRWSMIKRLVSLFGGNHRKPPTIMQVLSQKRPFFFKPHVSSTQTSCPPVLKPCPAFIHMRAPWERIQFKNTAQRCVRSFWTQPAPPGCSLRPWRPANVLPTRAFVYLSCVRACAYVFTGAQCRFKPLNLPGAAARNLSERLERGVLGVCTALGQWARTSAGKLWFGTCAVVAGRAPRGWRTKRGSSRGRLCHSVSASSLQKSEKGGGGLVSRCTWTSFPTTCQTNQK